MQLPPGAAAPTGACCAARSLHPWLDWLQETDGSGNIKFLDDAIRVERYLGDYSDNMMEAQISTVGAVSVHINSNEMTDAESSESWIDFDCQ